MRRIVWVKIRALVAKFMPVVPGILVVVFLCHQSSIKRLHFDDTRRRPRISWRETPLLVTPHTLQSILHTTTRPRLQLACTRSARARGSRVPRSPQLLQVLRCKNIVPERTKLLDKLNVRRKPLHVKQLVLGKPTKL